MSIEELIRRYEAGGGHLAKTSAEGLAVPPALHTVVLTCMDSRLDVFALFGLQMGEVHVLRNAGGVVTDDVIRSLTISQRKLQTREILLMQHAGCGLGTFTDEDFSEELANEVGMRPPWRTHAFRDPGVSVRRDMAQLRHDPFLLPRHPGPWLRRRHRDLRPGGGLRRGGGAVGRADARAGQPGDQVGSRRRVTTARWSLPGMSCTDSVSAVIPPVISTWSICGPSHRGSELGHVPTRPSPVRSAASEHPVIAVRNTEWSRVALKSPATITGPACRSAHQRPSVARSLLHSGIVAGRRRDRVEGDEAQVAEAGAGHLDGREPRAAVDLRRDVAEVGPHARRDALDVAATLVGRDEPVVRDERGEPVPVAGRRLGQRDEVRSARPDERGDGVDVALALVGVERQHRQRAGGGRVRLGDVRRGQRAGQHHRATHGRHREQAGRRASSPACGSRRRPVAATASTSRPATMAGRNDTSWAKGPRWSRPSRSGSRTTAAHDHDQQREREADGRTGGRVGRGSSSGGALIARQSAGRDLNRG